MGEEINQMLGYNEVAHSQSLQLVFRLNSSARLFILRGCARAFENADARGASLTAGIRLRFCLRARVPSLAFSPSGALYLLLPPNFGLRGSFRAR